jgi:hypothetical protein
VAYIDVLSAPSKELVWFEESGHEPFVDEPAKFNAAMVGLVRQFIYNWKLGHALGPLTLEVGVDYGTGTTTLLLETITVTE